jgi:5-methyltetrahydropteroyltriglutamate--homocysteine methyltransferase
MRQSIDELLTTHSGSLPRPQSERELLEAQASGETIDPERLEDEIRRAVVDVVRRQVDAGITVVNDGEVSKEGFHDYIKERLTGFEVVELRPQDSSSDRGKRERDSFPEYYSSRPDSYFVNRRRGGKQMGTCCVEKIEWKNFDEVERDIRNLKAATQIASVEDVFMSAISPGDTLRKFPNHHYPTEEEYMYAVADAMRREYLAIIDAGFVLQVDCPDLTTGAHPAQFGLEEFRKEIRQNVEILNYATRDIPPERMRIHVCWGSMERPHSMDPELGDIVDILLEARPAGMTLVGSNGRHAFEWEVWRDVKLPEGKVIIPGVVDSTTNIVEHPEVVADRIVRYAEVLGKENMIPGTDCGFQTTIRRGQVTPSIAWAKLRALAEGARLATRQLWPARSTQPVAR